jgi:AraC-like DNA-binding protein
VHASNRSSLAPHLRKAPLVVTVPERRFAVLGRERGDGRLGVDRPPLASVLPHGTRDTQRLERVADERREKRVPEPGRRAVATTPGLGIVKRSPAVHGLTLTRAEVTGVWRPPSFSGNVAFVHIWRTTSDSDTGGFTHTLTSDAGRSLLALVTATTFQELRVSASLWDGARWWQVHREANLAAFEHQHGVETLRWSYNDRNFTRVLAGKKALRGEHAGYSDLFVPVLYDGNVVAVLVVGPFALAQPTSADILSRWRRLTGRQGHPSDSEFTAYLRTTLSTLVLDGGNLAAFEKLCGCFARLIAGAGRADELTNRAHALRLELQGVRVVDQTWDAVRSMIDDRSSLVHFSPALAYDLLRLGLSRSANQVLVGLATSRSREIDPVEDAVRRDAFQRSAVAIARGVGETLAGRVGDHGIVFLSAAPRSSQQAKHKLSDLARRTSGVARRRFALAVHFGTSSTTGATPLSRCYQAALGAAELAVGQRRELVVAEPDATPSAHSLGALREELGREVEEHPERLPARFERYLEAVAAHCGYRPEPTRAHLEVGFERVADALLRSGTLDRKSLSSMQRSLARSATDARTTGELLVAYRRAALDLSEAAEGPAASRQARGVRGALEYIQQHYGEPLSLEKVARVAGFAPKYFSDLFRKREKVTFERYLSDLRLERAKQLLSGTELSATRVAELCGFRSPQYLCHVFRRAIGMTPVEFRRDKLPDWAKTSAKRIEP